MNNFAPQKLDTAFVQPNTPMFAELIERLSVDTNLSPSRQRDLKSGLRRVAKALARPVETVPADPKWLQPRLENIAPASIGLSSKSWSNALSDGRAAMAHFGIVKTRANRLDDLSGDWRRLWALLLKTKDPTLSTALCRFVHYLNRSGVRPEAVNDGHATAYREALALNAISRSPDVSYRAAVNGWNLATRRLAEWPQQVLTLPCRQRRIQLPLEDFPRSFQDGLRQYLHSLEHPDPFSDEGRLMPLQPATVKQYRLILHRFASILVHSGQDIASITSFADLVDTKSVERGLRWMLKQNADKSSPNIFTTARLLHEIGKGYLRLPATHQSRLKRFVSRVTPKQQRGMTSKNRERLRALDDKATLRRFLCLPDRMFEQARDLGDVYRAHLLRETGLAIAILLYCPIRKKNLSAIHLDENIQKSGDGRTFLMFTPDLVKNNRPIEFELPPPVTKLLDAHLAQRSPQLCPAACPWLFPKRDGSKSIDANQLATNVKNAIKREIGIDFNMHLFRHLSAKLWLDANPGQYEVVRRLLGHSELSTTMNVYAGFEAGTATRLFSEVISAGKMQ